MILYAVAAFLFFMITFISTRERIKPIAKERTNIKNDLKDISRNVPWILLFIVTILFILFVCIKLSVTAHYFKYYIGEQVVPWLTQIINFFREYLLNPIYGLFGKQETVLLEETHKFGFDMLASAFNTVGQAFSLIGVMLIPYFTKINGRKNALTILFVIALICTGSYFFFKPHNLVWIFLMQVFGSVTGGPISTLLWVMYADAADYSEWKTGRRATGLVYSASIMSNKLGWAIGSAIAGGILYLTGFVANVVQNINVLNGLKSMMSIIPVAAGCIALTLLLFFYKLDEPTMKKIKEELDERRKASGVEVS